MLGLQIGVALNKATEPGQSDLAIITIGDSVIELPCTENGIDKDNIPNVKINLTRATEPTLTAAELQAFLPDTMYLQVVPGMMRTAQTRKAIPAALLV